MLPDNAPPALPHNIEAEAALIGALMIESSLIDHVADRLTAEDFYEGVHGRIFATIVGQHSQGKSATPPALKPYLENDPALTELGGIGYLATLTASGIGILGAKDFVEQIRDMSKRRTIIASLIDATESLRDSNIPVSTAIDGAEATLGDSGEQEGGAREMSAAECALSLLAEHDTPQTGVRCGIIPSLDKTMGTIGPGNLIIVAGRPGMGKTALALDYAGGVARMGESGDEFGGAVLMFSLDMGAEELGGRLIASVASETHPIPYTHISNRWMTQDEQTRAYRVAERLRNCPLQIIDTPALTVPRMSMMVRRWKRRFAARGIPLKLVVVDYLQLMRSGRKTDGRTDEVGEISRGLKAIAKEHGLGVMALSQLNRGVESRDDKRPRLSDLRESGQIEQDADRICFVYRPGYYHEQSRPPEDDLKFAEWDAERLGLARRLELIIAKRRDGPSGMCVADYDLTNQAIRGHQ